ncbi:hypothetical protein CLAFUW4_11991 [Fulvia fulva]|uniref:Uncharacterized protein n=1 Tax=Passalora fulva TaxID=5499 RepID=A0A9Q8PF64_PASFU|nr:uncharacterized protein CLAFUR5_11032 [Fulvia fulva]KAK4618227.1 hypothetical protein CLAFUR4_11996 [Fulvia fulva]KAK4619174.1 hypothetical protein CLAFUR0_12007 [Fulvia fulva]UJO21292.1 hypothetical protein CLAFUR5_11032 [Fulvia fulva]WPV18413.1 hypothetical protein CLAFUW4_11991 [Fulvia fulva]WPV33581.1 hypothetical protein CLAFUW7_11998 [Fulvia fulva]
MNQDYLMSAISRADFRSALQAYPTLISPELAALDGSRYESIPNSLALQVSKGGIPSLSRSQRQVLQDWTTARSSNRSAAQAFDKEVNERLMNSAFKRVGQSVSEYGMKKSLQDLKGVGMVHASLLSSVCRPKDVPFFSKEFYSVEEYLVILKEAQSLRGRLGEDVGMMGTEKVAFVLVKWGKVASGKREVAVGEGSEDELS